MNDVLDPPGRAFQAVRKRSEVHMNTAYLAAHLEFVSATQSQDLKTHFSLICPTSLGLLARKLG